MSITMFIVALIAYVALIGWFKAESARLRREVSEVRKDLSEIGTYHDPDLKSPYDDPDAGPDIEDRMTSFSVDGLSVEDEDQ